MSYCGRSHRRQGVQLLLAAAVLLPCTWGDTIPSIYNYEAYGNTLDGPLGQTPSGLCSSETFVSVVFSVSNCSSASGVVTSASSLATFTALHAQSSLTLANATLPAGITASGYARTVDDLSAPSGVAFLGFTFDVDGTLADSGLTDALVTLNFGFAYDNGFAGQGPDGCSRSISSGLTTVSFTCSTRLYPIALFDQNTYWFSISAQEHLDPSTVPVSGSASASFFSTATITSVQAYDANGNFIPDAVISSLGNGGNPFVVSAVPEPTSLSLLVVGGLAFVALVSLKRYRGSTSRFLHGLRPMGPGIIKLEYAQERCATCRISHRKARRPPLITRAFAMRG